MWQFTNLCTLAACNFVLFNSNIILCIVFWKTMYCTLDVLCNNAVPMLTMICDIAIAFPAHNHVQIVLLHVCNNWLHNWVAIGILEQQTKSYWHVCSIVAKHFLLRYNAPILAVHCNLKLCKCLLRMLKVIQPLHILIF